jgi:hypothetical protein
MQSLPTVLLTGTAGAGKTAVAKEIGELLRRVGVRYAVIDLDALGEIHPPCAEGTFNSPLIARNLAAIWPKYRLHGIDRLVLARVVGSAAEVTAYRSAVPEADIKICRLVAPPETVSERLTRREPGIKHEFLIRMAPGLDDELSRLALEDFAVDNNATKSVTGVALEVLCRLGWPEAAAAEGAAADAGLV